MKVTFKTLNIDESSTKFEPLEYAGVKVGEYSYGLWSKFFNTFIPNGQYVPDAATYVKRLYFLKYKKGLRSEKEVFEGKELLKADGYTFSSFAKYIMEKAITQNKIDIF